MSSRNDCRIYVGNLPPDIRTKDVEDLFYRFGKVVFVDLKNRRGKMKNLRKMEYADPSFCFKTPLQVRLLLLLSSRTIVMHLTPLKQGIILIMMGNY